ncbi:MAG: hypothetical protein V4858_10805 [Pseudomonadota bacterium]
MKAVFKVKTLACGALMLCTAMGSTGLTLGRAQGVVFVGKPLDLRVQVQFDASEDIQDACMGAEVFYGDTPLDASRVSVLVEPATGGARGPIVRVLSSVLVDEPVITVNFRVGCQQKLSKRYTVFSEVATHVVEPPVRVPARTAPAAVAPPVVGVATPLAAAAPDGPATTTPKKAKSVAPANAAPAAATAPTQQVAPPVANLARSAQSPKASGKSRLKLDSLDLLIDRDPVLQATSELLTLPQEDPQKRSEAAALWRALNASPEETLRDEARARAMEKDLKALYAVTAENQKGLMDLVAKVQRAESERYANGLVYTLAALCLASLVALVWMWRRARTARPRSWLQGAEADDSLMAELVQEAKAPASRAAALHATPAAAKPPKPETVPAHVPVTELDLDLDLMTAPPSEPMWNEPEAQLPQRAGLATPPRARVPDAALVTPANRAAARDFSVSVAGGLRAIDSEELMDVRQQAEFFMSLGETQKAIDVLTTRIAQVGESSPLVCLDLLKIYHKLGREPEYEFMRQEFNNWFTGRVPVIDDFRNEGQSLERYPEVIDRIVALWPDPRVLEYIENCIYHHSSDVYEPEFDLLAYRELLLLHGVAKRIVRLSDGSGDSHASELLRIPARAPTGLRPEGSGNIEVAHRVGPQHRGAWKRSPPKAPEVDPEEEVVTSGAPLSAINPPPVTTPEPLIDERPAAAAADKEQGSLTEFNFLSLR